ncbi:MAG: dicarboxylate/amino acid:cation symporter [Cellvibrionaceae bacterium]
MSLTVRILIAMAAGLGVGILLNLASQQQWLNSAIIGWVDEFVIVGVFDAVGRIFVASLKLLVVPLVFVSLVCGASSLGGNSRMGAMAAKTLCLYMLTTALAISIALLLGSLIRPGDGIGLGEASTFAAKTAPSLKDVVVNIFPSNPIQAMAEGNMLQVIVFSLLMGIAIAQCGDSGSRVKAWFEDMNDVVMKMVSILMELAPYGVFCLLAKLFAGLGASAIIDLSLYFSTVVLALALHCFGVYSLILKSLTRIDPLAFFRHLRPLMMFAFSTSSSNATLPITLRTAEEKLGVDNRIASFTVPLGATINMDGTAIMQGVATAFIAQAYQVDIGLSGYLMVVLTATLASVGTAGVPGVGLITLAMVLQQVNLPVEGIALIIGVDRLLDMLRTAVNVSGDSMVTLTVAKSEGLWDQDTFEGKALREST